MLQRLQVFYRNPSTASVEVCAYLPASPETAGVSLAGVVQGPHCELASTLPAKNTLQDASGPQSLYARTVVPDPCFWSPELPARYSVRVEARRGGQVLDAAEWELGIRPLAVGGRNLYWEGRRWVLRGVWRDEVPATEMTNWRDASAAMIVDRWDETLADTASRQGVLLVVRVEGTPSQLAEQLDRISRCPAAGLVIVSNNQPLSTDLRAAAPNILLVQERPMDGSAMEHPWAHVAMASASDPAALARTIKDCPLPVLAARRSGPAESISLARAACDDLQRDLAPWGDLAGYIV